MNPIEVQMLASMSPTGKLTRNPQTGQPEAFLPFLAPLLGSFLGSSLLTGAGAGILGAAGLGSAAAGAIGSGLATTLATGDLEQGIMSGITGFGIGSALGGLGAAGTEAAKAGTDAATGVAQAGTQAAATPMADLASAASGVSEGFGASINPIADQLAQSVPQSLAEIAPQVGEGFGASAGAMSTAAGRGVTSPAMTASERFALPFQQPGQLLSELSKPGSFLPVYVGESNREAAAIKNAGQNSMRNYEREQEAEKDRIRQQMAGVFSDVRSAYPGVGYAAGGMIEKYPDGGFINMNPDIQNAIDSMRFANSMPSAENVQLSLRGSQVNTPPQASYSALDVGGQGYMPGVAPEFQFFTNPPPAATPPGPAPGEPGGPANPFFPDRIDDLMSEFRGSQRVDLSGLEGRMGGIESRLGQIQNPYIPPTDFSGLEERLAGLNEGIGSIRSSMPKVDLSGLESRIDALANRPAPEFDYDRIPTQQPYDFSMLESRLDALANRPAPQFDMNPVLDRLGSLESMLSSRRSLEPDNQFGSDYMAFAEGGMTPTDMGSQQPSQDDIAMVAAAIRGEVENSDEVISQFVQMYGPDVFMQVREMVLQSVVPGAQTQGMVQGQGGGQDDMVTGMIGSQRPVAVSPGEYIIPADAVSLAGGGYSGDGAKFFDSLVNDIRQKTMGKTEQVKPYRSM
jgi:hypothetical protein